MKADDLDVSDIGEPEEGDVDMEDPLDEQVGVEKKLTPDGGVVKKLITAGTGYISPENGDDVEVHYVGTLDDGTTFDSSRDRGTPFTFVLGKGNVIKGWDIGVKSMKKGEKCLLICKPEYAYGDHGSPPKIPGGATLNFEVELLSWKSHKDLTGDGGVIKTVVTEGEGWKVPGKEDELKVAFTLKTAEGAVVDSSPEGGVEFSPEEGYVIPAFKRALEDMKKGEVVDLIIKPEYGFGETGKPPLVGPDTILHAELKLLSWKAVEKITPDGGVVKKTLNETSGYQTPGTDSKITIRYTGKLENGTVFDEHGEGNELECLADDDLLIEGLDLAILKMKTGELAEVIIKPQYAFGTNEPSSPHYNPAVPANATVIYTVELIQFEPEKASWDLSEEEKIAEAGTVKERGNAKFKAGLWKSAIKRYEKATKLIDFDKNFKDENLKKSTEIKRSCNLNLAAAQLKLGAFKKAVEACNQVLEKDSQNVKALYRRAQAYLGGQDLIEAELDIKAALAIDPANREVRILHQQWKRASAEYAKKEKQIFGNMFDKLSKKKGREVEKANHDGPEPNGVTAQTESSQQDTIMHDAPPEQQETWHPTKDEMIREVEAQ